MKLTIFSVSMADYGMYKCVAKNPRGETDGTIRLYGKFKNKKFICARAACVCMYIYNMMMKCVARRAAIIIHMHVSTLGVSRTFVCIHVCMNDGCFVDKSTAISMRSEARARLHKSRRALSQSSKLLLVRQGKLMAPLDAEKIHTLRFERGWLFCSSMHIFMML